jgi:hypothetical protein
MRGQLLLLGVLVLSLLATILTPAAAEPDVREARITYYVWTGQPMASGLYPYPGVAACSYDLPLETWIVLDGVLLQCLDRGHLTPTWVDVYCADEVCAAWVAGLGPTEPVEVY